MSSFPGATPAMIRRAKKRGIVVPIRAARAAKKAGIPYAVACASLAQESYGGRNVFGHDAMDCEHQPSIESIKGKRVTRTLYRRYKEHRKRGCGMQGVGPSQLTYYTFQDEADRRGGCWRPYPNMRTGFGLLAHLRDVHGKWREAFRAYNGSGPAAEAYADTMMARVRDWEQWLR